MISYNQQHSKARQHNAKFFVFQNVTPGVSNPYLSLQSAQASDSRVREYIENREKYSVPLIDPTWHASNYDGPSAVVEVMAIQRGEYRTSHALINLASAKSLLNRYTMSIPIEASNRSTRDQLWLHMPQFEEDRLILPAHIPSVARCIVLPDQFKSSSKKQKENVLSLIACVRLHTLNLLNERLLPLKRNDMQNKLLGVALTELFASGKATKQKSPPQPGASNQVYMYRIVQKGDAFDQNEVALGGNGRMLCIITLTKFAKVLPNFHFTHLDLGDITCKIEEPKAQTLSHDQWVLCSMFHTALMNTRWRKRSKSAFYRYAFD